MNEQIDMNDLNNMNLNNQDLVMNGMVEDMYFMMSLSLIFIVIFMLIYGWGIYSLSKKMGLKNSWLGWIPYLQYYTMTKIAGIDFVKGFLLPFIAYILAAFAGGFLSVFGEIGGLIGIILMIVAFIYFIVKYIKILSETSRRTGRGGWTTAGLFFIPFIMYPVVAYKYKKNENSNPEIPVESKEKEEEQKVEL